MSLEEIYKALRILNWTRSLQHKNEPPVYPNIQAEMHRILRVYEESFKPKVQDKPIPVEG